MFLFMERLLEISMKFGKSRNKAVRIAGIIIGEAPLRYAEYMEKRLMSGKWDPGRKWRKKYSGVRRRTKRKQTSVCRRTNACKYKENKSVR